MKIIQYIFKIIIFALIDFIDYFYEPINFILYSIYFIIIKKLDFFVL